MIKAVLFDMDGTLINTERTGFEWHKQNCARMGLTLTQPFFASLMGRSWEEISEMLDREFDGRYPWESNCRACLDYMLGMVERGEMALMPGVEECFAALKRMGIKIGLVTTTPLWQVEKYQQHIPALQNTFDAMIRGEESPIRKPAPDPFLLCMKKLGLTPEECIGVEDGMAGLKAIRAAGMTSVFVPDLLTMNDEIRPNVDYTLKSLFDLPKLIEYLHTLHNLNKELEEVRSSYNSTMLTLGDFLTLGRETSGLRREAREYEAKIETLEKAVKNHNNKYASNFVRIRN